MNLFANVVALIVVVIVTIFFISPDYGENKTRGSRIRSSIFRIFMGLLAGFFVRIYLAPIIIQVQF